MKWVQVQQAYGNASGNWRLKEIEFIHTQINGFKYWCSTGTRSTFLTGGSNQNRMHIGRIVKVMQHGNDCNSWIFPVMACR